MSTGGGTKTSERVMKLKENFMRLHEEGYSIYEIAEMYGVHYSTVYNRLEEIAKENNVTREELLREVHKTPAFWERQAQKMKVDVDNLVTCLEQAKEKVQNIQKSIEEISAEMDREFNEDNKEENAK